MVNQIELDQHGHEYNEFSVGDWYYKCPVCGKLNSCRVSWYDTEDNTQRCPGCLSDKRKEELRIERNEKANNNSAAGN